MKSVISISNKMKLYYLRGSEAIILSLMAMRSGDEVLVPEPSINYNGFACEAGLVIKPITTKAEEGFHLPSKEYIKSLINQIQSYYDFNHATNGTVYTKVNLKCWEKLLWNMIFPNCMRFIENLYTTD